jgi:hypothetical protein
MYREINMDVADSTVERVSNDELRRLSEQPQTTVYTPHPAETREAWDMQQLAERLFRAVRLRD